MPYKNAADKAAEQRQRRATPEGRAKRALYRSRARVKANPSVRDVAEALAASVLWERQAARAKRDLDRSIAAMRR